jgi:sugar/nucleoside kinase (ribokinase family)
MDHEIDVVIFNSYGIGQNVLVPHLPVPGETMQALRWEMDIDASKGINIAIALGRLGVKAAFVGQSGDDFLADFAERLLLEAGVYTGGLHRNAAQKTSTGIVFIDQDGENSIV